MPPRPYHVESPAREKTVVKARRAKGQTHCCPRRQPKRNCNSRVISDFILS
ncbi:hypothetical protein SAY86_019316 [Trapa natans]|uniref:Uncharacterized protein n=1 Tax=Trapa natans TaxID=22666 RepID=A0AAN7R353_TRANT|nr:hypothetical protein SAY86_019316 [Trapa natans]